MGTTPSRGPYLVGSIQKSKHISSIEGTYNKTSILGIEPTLLERLGASLDDELFQPLRVFPPCWRKIGVGFVRMFNE